MRFHRMTCPEHLPHHLARQRNRDPPRIVDNLTRNFVGAREQRILRKHFRNQPRCERLLGAKDAPCCNPFHCFVDAHNPRQEPTTRRLGNNAPSRKDEAKLRFFARKTNVHRQRLRDPDADCRPVNRCDHRLLEIERAKRDSTTAVSGHRTRAFGVVLRSPGIKRCAATAQVGSRAKTSPRTRDDHDAYAIVVIHRVVHCEKVIHHLRVKCIESIGTIQRDGQHTIVECGRKSFVRREGCIRFTHELILRDGGALQAPRVNPRA